MPAETKRWYQIRWFADSDTKQDRKLICKLDLLIVPYAFLAYWAKYIDQANLNNAYVAGMKEDLGLNGNHLIQLQSLYIVGAVYRAASYGELAAYRFLVGLFEAAFFPAMHYIFGSWYRGNEIARRGGVFYVGLTLGTLTAALIQSSASARLDGVSGLAGWRWMYIICAVITLPIGVIGYFILPGTPDQPNRLFLTDAEIALARERLQRDGHQSSGKVTWATVRSLVTRWQVWLLVLLDVFFWNGSINTTTGGYLLWLKSLGRYSNARLNALGAISPGLGIFYTLLVCFASDLLLGPAWAITLSHAWNIVGLVILVVWDVPEGAKWFAFFTTYSAVAMSSVLYGWVNSQLRASPAERSFTLVMINAISQSTTAWTQILTFPTVEAPRFTKGYAFVLANAVCLIALAHVLARDGKSDRLTDTERSVVEEVDEVTTESDTPDKLH
ncbi:MFS transporter Seo1, putative [Cordyceps militaris CM01]|uniref:MFS transporter Seo1, putative n=1 Tax=Cordyceps militaris (strain CM01) TaxID=983644 RepID=G3JLB2_CORMM|nr:MFS transporter Seo1, putative [Cordyceps militaris CM01]EGX90486.1 MFS transporter Seo1, putative [Cordyceps militaris CM01]